MGDIVKTDYDIVDTTSGVGTLCDDYECLVGVE